MTHYSATGKQVLSDGRQHIADAVDNHTAQQIADALNHYDDNLLIECDTLDLPLEQETHLIHREGDEYACSCGKRWDVAEGRAHP